MYYNVVIKNHVDYLGEQLVFYFGDNFEKALDFVNYIAKISDYNIELLQLDKEEE